MSAKPGRDPVARLLAVFVGLALLVLIPFAIWGGEVERVLSPEAAATWLRGYGAWAWAVGLGLLVADLVLPIPATAVISALGFIYGPLAGGLVGSAGSILTGALGYGLCRAAGPRAARRLLGEHGLAQGEKLASGTGPWLVVLSRWLPVFPEVVACMAGLTRMPSLTFLAALACGSVPLSFAFAAVGHAGLEHPGLALALSALAPPIMWLAVRPLFVARLRRDTHSSGAPPHAQAPHP
jgi:uncharacterized membrane protein YdjX (TVP38/TMEM64 family)